MGESLADEPGARALSGLERLQGVAAGRFPQAPILRLLGMALVDARPGRVVFHGAPGPDHDNFMGIVHGGYSSLLLDSALGCAVYTETAPDEGCATVSLEIKLVRTVEAGAELIAEACVRHRGRRQATADGEVTTADGRLVAHGTTTVMVGLPLL